MGQQNLLQNLGPPGILVVVGADHDGVLGWLPECWKIKIRLGCCAAPVSALGLQISNGGPSSEGKGILYLETVSL